MNEWLHVMVVAFLAQLAVLPGEKVQFIIAGLSTRYNPLVVVSAAGTAFAGWTALEIWFGGALQELLSPFYLNLLTGALFALFAVMLLRSAPEEGGVPAETDGGVFGGEELDVRIPVVDWRVPNAMGGWLPIFAMMGVGEFGDKTQLVTIGLAAQYGATPAIWVGEMLAVIPVSLLNAFFFFKFSHRFDLRKAHYASAALFGFFAFDTFLSTVTGVSIWETAVNGIANAVLALA